MLPPASQIAHELRQLAQVLEPQYSASRGGDHERIGVCQVRERPIHRPQPPILTMKVDSVLTPVAVSERDEMHLSVAWVKRVEDPKSLLSFLRSWCS